MKSCQLKIFPLLWPIVAIDSYKFEIKFLQGYIAKCMANQWLGNKTIALIINISVILK